MNQNVWVRIRAKTFEIFKNQGIFGMGNFENNIDNHNNGAVDVDRYNGICADDDADDENVTMKKAERLRRSLLPALSITTAAKKVATI